ncbi:MAG TPA: phosphatase PAP2 family protein [Clostridiales bacterium]|nr:phosphatase PAP2 family protein [Clostridiales bacterium]
MKKLSKNQWIYIAITTTVFIALMLVAAFLDLEISNAIYNTKSILGNLGNVLGTLPTMLFIPLLGATIFVKNFPKLNKNWKTAVKIGGVIITFAGYISLFVWAKKYLIQKDLFLMYFYIVFFSIILTAFNIYIFTKLSSTFIDKFFIVLMFFAIVAIITGLLTQIFKFLFARQRYRTMVDSFYENNQEALAGYWIGKDAFRPWYIPNSIFKPKYSTSEYRKIFKNIDSGAFMSFPSGHTSSAGVSFALIILPRLSKKFNKNKWVFWLIPAVITILTGISRVLYGAHFFSDVVAGGFLSLGIAVLSRYIILKKRPSLENCFDDEISVKVLDEHI